VRSLLVTGGAGFIGSNFVHYWVGAHPGDRVVVLDALTYAGNLANLRALIDERKVQFVLGDIGDSAAAEQLMREAQVDTIVHFAAESHVDRSISGPDAFIATNVVGTHSLLKAAKACWLGDAPVPEHRFHHISTDEVFGSLGSEDAPFTERTAYSPNSPYAASKAASDHLVQAYHHTYGLQTTLTNCSNNYGPFHFPEKLIPLTIVNILEGRAIPVYGDGRNVRDWLHVLDHCRGIDRVLSAGRVGQAYALGGSNELTNIDLVELLCSIADDLFRSDARLAQRFPRCPAVQGHTSELITYVKDRPGHDRRYAINAAKARDELGFNPEVSVEQGVASTFRWFIENEEWWRAIMNNEHRKWTDTQHHIRPAT
jgi:dTDP-glucose 4,6-dehydratase